jgi:hypothetical protein
VLAWSPGRRTSTVSYYLSKSKHMLTLAVDSFIGRERALQHGFRIVLDETTRPATAKGRSNPFDVDCSTESRVLRALHSPSPSSIYRLPSGASYYTSPSKTESNCESSASTSLSIPATLAKLSSEIPFPITSKFEAPRK